MEFCLQAEKTIESVKKINKIANFPGKLPQNNNSWNAKFFAVLFKHLSDHLSVLFQFA